jgi:hypothetical protein
VRPRIGPSLPRAGEGIAAHSGVSNSGFDQPGEIAMLPSSRRAVALLRNRKFADSPLEEAGFEPGPGNRDTLFDPLSSASASPKVVAFGIASGEGPPRAPIIVPGRAQRRLAVEAK